VARAAHDGVRPDGGLHELSAVDRPHHAIARSTPEFRVVRPVRGEIDRYLPRNFAHAAVDADLSYRRCYGVRKPGARDERDRVDMRVDDVDTRARVVVRNGQLLQDAAEEAHLGHVVVVVLEARVVLVVGHGGLVLRRVDRDAVRDEHVVVGVGQIKACAAAHALHLGLASELGLDLDVVVRQQAALLGLIERRAAREP